jgi:hypothetical protein
MLSSIRILSAPAALHLLTDSAFVEIMTPPDNKDRCIVGAGGSVFRPPLVTVLFTSQMTVRRMKRMISFFPLSPQILDETTSILTKTKIKSPHCGCD